MATSGPRRSRHRTTAQPAGEVETFLTSVAPDQRRLLMAARALIKNLVPSAVERVRVGWGLLGFSAPRYFAFVVASNGAVRLGFEHGILLDDQWGLLQGTGTQVRWIETGRVEDLEAGGVGALICQAAELARRPPPSRSRGGRPT